MKYPSTTTFLIFQVLLTQENLNFIHLNYFFKKKKKKELLLHQEMQYPPQE